MEKSNANIGTVGRLVKKSGIPYNVDGSIPDITINPDIINQALKMDPSEIRANRKKIYLLEKIDI